MDTDVQLHYNIKLLGKPFTEIDPRNHRRIIRGYEFEGHKYYEPIGETMTIDENVTEKITSLKPAMFQPGLFVNLRLVCDKDTMKWILIKFLKESLDYLGDPENKETLKKMKRGTMIENWIDSNLPNLEGDYDRSQ